MIMQARNPGIVFMGTPEFAVASLDAILNAGYTLKGVVTSPDKPSGRGLQLHPSPVKEYALKHGLHVLQPTKLKDPDFLTALRSLNPDLQVVVAFRMLPEEVWSLPRLGTFNLHASLLPQYRGAAPINWAVINGERATGVTTFFINHEIDKGSVLFTAQTPIYENESAGDVHDRLMQIGAELVVKTIREIASGRITPVEQHLIGLSEPMKAAPKIFRDDCRIHWNLSTQNLHNFIRGLSPHPAAWTELITDDNESVIFKIFRAKPLLRKHELAPGSLVTDGRHYIHVASGDGFMELERIQMQAKKQMSVEEFLRGYTLTEAHRFM